MEIKKGIIFGLVLTAALTGAYFLNSARRPVAEAPEPEGLSDGDRELVGNGKKIFFGKGQCALCHTLTGEGRGKCPDLQGAGARLTREFIYEAMTKPDAYVKLDFESVTPKKFPARMPEIDKPPIGLTEQEMTTVIAFLQSQGGKVTVSQAELK